MSWNGPKQARASKTGLKVSHGSSFTTGNRSRNSSSLVNEVRTYVSAIVAKSFEGMNRRPGLPLKQYVTENRNEAHGNCFLGDAGTGT